MSERAGTTIEVKVIGSLDELALYVQDTFARSEARWWFRGQTDSTWSLVPKVWRDYDALSERYLTNLFYQRAKLRHASFPNDNDYASWLALMQHYGLPTRLLDWSNSALIAAYFAVKYDSDMSRPARSCDAAIWMLQPETLNANQGYGTVFPSLNARSLEPMVHGAFKERYRRSVIRAKKMRRYNVLAAVSPNQDLRMVMQQGAFTIHVNASPLDEQNERHNWLKKILVPYDAIPRLRASLDVLGVRLSDVFPDLPHLATELTNMHRPRAR